MKTMCGGKGDLVLHIGNNRSVPRRDIVAVLDVKALGCALPPFELSEMEKGLESARSVIVCESKGRTTYIASPISTAALSLRGPF